MHNFLSYNNITRNKYWFIEPFFVIVEVVNSFACWTLTIFTFSIPCIKIQTSKGTKYIKITIIL